MKKKRIIFDFGSTYFSIFSDGRLLLRKPAAIVLKKSLQAQTVCVGEEAVARIDALTADEHFVRPVVKGVVANKEGCVALIKSYVNEAVGKFAFPHICILVGCGLNSDRRAEIEKVFMDAGFLDIILMESLMGMAPACSERNLKAALIVGGATTEFGLFENLKLLKAYSIDIGSDTVNQRIKIYVREKYKLNISDSAAEELKLKAAGLYIEDRTEIAIEGKDSITGRIKKITVSAKELYPEVTYVFERILKVVEAALTVAPIDILKAVAVTGLLATGYGCMQDGFVTYVSRHLRLPVFLADKAEYLPMSGAEKLCSMPDFEDKYLGLNKQISEKNKTFSFIKKR